jgi:hypothetical protein
MRERAMSVEPTIEGPPAAGRWRHVLRSVAVFATIGFVFAACDADDPATTSRPETTVLSTATNQTGDGSASGQRNPGNAYSSFGIYEAVNFASGTSGTTVSCAEP